MSLDPLHAPLLGPLFASAPLRAALGEAARLQRMLDVEAALARAQASLGLVPPIAVAPIAAACRAELYDATALGEAARAAGNLAIPLVGALTARVAAADPAAARFVHLGATSQDVLDTGLVLQLREAAALIDRALAHAIDGFARHAEAHVETPMAGRTWLQQAVPITAGLKFAGFAAALARARRRLRRSTRAAMLVSFGGAAGTLAALADQGIAVAERLAAELDLAAPDAPWHAHRDRLAALAADLALLAGSCGKIAGDIALMSQSEVGEAAEGAPGGSSAMPHKQNPVACAQIRAAATLVPGLLSALLTGMTGEHERALGGWQAEWVAMPQLVLLAGGAVERTAELDAGLVLDPARMSANLEHAGGLVTAEAVTAALAAALGRLAAHERVAAACRRAIASQRPLAEILAEDEVVAAHLDGAALARLLAPSSYLGSATEFTRRALADARAPLE